MSWPNKYANWPKYLPFPQPLRRSRRPVPNASSVNWPQAQFAPLYLPPGSPSFQPYSYLKQDVPLESIQPVYRMGMLVGTGQGPSGDRAALPSSDFGDPMLPSVLVPIHYKLLKGLPFGVKGRIRRLERLIQKLSKDPRKAKTRARLLQRHSQIRAKLAGRGSASGFVSKAHVSGHTARGAHGYGDGMAYELAPLQAAPNSIIELGALGCGCDDLAGDCGCGSKHNPAFGAEFLQKIGIKDEEHKLTKLGWAAVLAAAAGGIYVATR